MLNVLLQLASAAEQDVPHVCVPRGGVGHVRVLTPHSLPKETRDVCAVVHTLRSRPPRKELGQERQHVTTPGRHDNGSLIGLLTGTFVGAGLAMWLAHH
jgi:hypothetical protein